MAETATRVNEAKGRVGAPVAHVHGLHKTYGPDVRALVGVSLSVRSGEFVAVLGPSGAGKTTLFRCLTGLTRPDAGAVVVDGLDVAAGHRHDVQAARRQIALIFQQFNLIRRLTALQNVLAGRLAEAPTWRVMSRHFARAASARSDVSMPSASSTGPRPAPTSSPADSSSG
jgi:phosphonate transport system ATP-binding protein